MKKHPFWVRAVLAVLVDVVFLSKSVRFFRNTITQNVNRADLVF